ncbi:MAG: hypothetical protein ACOCVL_03810 [Candidatus Sumerlaeota bacterium]
MNDGKILACRIPQSFRERLREGIKGRYDIQWLENEVETNVALRDERPAALLAGLCSKPSLEMPIRVANRLYPDLPVILVAPTANSETFVMMQSFGIGAAIPPTEVLYPEQIELFFRHYLPPIDNRGLARFYPKGHSIKKARIHDPARREDLLKDLRADFSDCKWVDHYDLQLLLEEMVNNAALHAFRTPRNQPKYGPNPKGELDADDQILIEWATEDPDNGAPYGAICVMDNQGVLAPGQIWRRLFRQSSQRGLLDTSGRGVYLTHLLTGLMGITVWPGQWTETIAFLTPAYSNEERPISVRVVR